MIVHNESVNRALQFGPFELQMGTGELRKNGIRLKLQGKSFHILEALLERPGVVVTREELKSRLWPGDTFVDFESGLNTAANRLRIALGDSAENPRFIETVARNGYRFIGTVTEIAPPQAEPQAASPLSEVTVAPSAPARRFQWAPIAALIAAAAVSLAFWTTARRAPAQPSFRQITFRRGFVSSARFSPDGQTILYSARWDGARNRLFLANTVSPESRTLDHDRSRVGSVSPSSELALLVDYGASGGTLTRVPLNGGAPLTVATSVGGAEWGRDGKSLAVYRITSRDSVIEYPIGTILYRTAGTISDLRVAPSGEEFAFLEHPFRGDDAGHVKLIDRRGVAKDLTGNWASSGGLAWSPSGKEVWFTAGQVGVRRTLYAATLNGKVRQIATLPGMLTLYDISKERRVLLALDSSRMMIGASLGGQEKEQDLSWFDWSHAATISPDGKFLLFDETGDGGGPSQSVYLRDTQTDSAVRLGDGIAEDLSPDLKWALAWNSKKPSILSILPIGPEASRTLSGHGFEYSWARVFPDGQHLLVGGNFPGKPLRLFVQPVSGGDPVPLNPDIYLAEAMISPDGRQIVGVSQKRKIVLLPASGGEVRELALPFEATPVQWSVDGKALFVRDLRQDHPARIFRFDLASSQVRPWKELSPADPVGLGYIMNIVMGIDAKSYAYSYLRTLSELFVVDGWS